MSWTANFILQKYGRELFKKSENKCMKWEYAIMTTEKKQESVQYTLDYMGRGGWELVCMMSRTQWVFKKPVPQKIETVVVNS